MKILYLTTVSGTINAFLVPHIEMLIKSGHTVDVACQKTKEINPKLIELGCKIYNVPFQRTPINIKNYKAYKKVRNILNTEDYDLLHTHTPVASTISRLAAKSFPNIKVFYTAHGFHFYKGAPVKNWLLYYPVERYLSKFTDTIITINQEDFNRTKNKFKAKNIEYIEGVGIDLSEIENLGIDTSKKKNSLDLLDSDFVLMSVGELNSNKNHKIVLEAIALIKNKNIKYIVCGKGKLKEQLIKYATDLDILNQVQFLGHRNDIYELLLITNVFIFPSLREGLPKSVMEAMASGKPVIASNIRGNVDLIDDNLGGYLFNPYDSNELAEKIEKLLNNKKEIVDMAEYNKTKINNYSLEHVLKTIKEIYK